MYFVLVDLSRLYKKNANNKIFKCANVRGKFNEYNLSSKHQTITLSLFSWVLITSAHFVAYHNFDAAKFVFLVIIDTLITRTILKCQND